MLTAMTTLHTSTFPSRTQTILDTLRDNGQMKRLQTIEGPMDRTVRLADRGEVLCFCSNNYLGLANHPEVVEAGVAGLRKYGAGTASVRFICGTFDCHTALEARIAEFYGCEAAYTFTSCWNANEAIFPTLCEVGDIIISDEFNHASIIDGIRLAGVIKKGLLRTVYKHNDVAALRVKLEEARANPLVTGTTWVVTCCCTSRETRRSARESACHRHNLGRDRRRVLDGRRHRGSACDACTLRRIRRDAGRR
ncbi:MAG: aminotransferase class I/II-fold pyridoxal phosphate-dependent enzyme [Planctomycetota bacterium]|nr:MAG: aminotransferase class I/II-fold pyridoxal phosphate-dependent enzyme [Planctomycetota bacterium]